MSMLINNNEYFEILDKIKASIREAQYKAVLGANKKLMELYWNIGNVIIANTKYGAKFLENLSKDILSEFPDIKGFSVRNLNYMRRFAEAYPDFQKVQRGVALLPWRNNITLISKVKNPVQREWYISKNLENGWNNVVLTHQIEMKLYERQAVADKIANYENFFPSPFSELAEETLKSPYVFDFVQKRKGIIEREIEHELVANIAKTLLELGTGFAFMGNQYHLCIDNEDYYIDLLFYNTKLRCYVVVELKSGKFKPEYAGKLNFYLSAIDDILKQEQDNPSIGILLCKERSKLTAEYALKDIKKPIGVSEYKLSDFVPAEFADTLPSAEDIEKRIKLELDIDGEEGDGE